MVDNQKDPWSITNADLRAQLQACRRDATDAALITVAAVDGSAYRRPGAKMLVPADGDAAGAVTAGCLEDAVQNIAADVISTDRPRIEVFDLMDNDGSWGLGLGCNGIIDVLVEPIDASFDKALTTLENGDSTTIATILDNNNVGRRTLITRDGPESVPDREPVPESVLTDAADAIDRLHDTGKTKTVTVTTGGQEYSLLIDNLQPVPEILLFGSQNDLSPLANLATEIGFRVTVHSPRGAVDDETIPAADRVVTGHPSTVADTVEIPEHTYAVMMSHNLVDDGIALRTLLKETTVPYVGLMGPRERFADLRENIANDDVTLTETELNRIATPVGLDLGSGEPVKIALSIVSEILAVSNNRAGDRLCNRADPIHPRTAPDLD